MTAIARHITKRVLFALEHHPIVLLNGARQSGKSTLVRHLAEGVFPAAYVTLDSATQLAAAAFSPESFLSARPGPLIIDEVQMAPELFRALKIIVDEARLADKAASNGRFLLTGSANIMALPKLSDPLVGRMSVKTLYPLAGCEIFGRESTFLERLFAADFASAPQAGGKLTDVIRKATFPEISGAPAEVRGEWFEGYLTTILQRDVRVLSELEKIAMLPHLLRIIAARAGNLMNDASIARDAGLNPVTSKSYRGVLQAMFLTFDVPPWYRNIGKRLVKSPKGYITDTLFLCHLQDIRLEDLPERKPHLYGHIAENFVAGELTKLLSFSDTRAKLLHFRTSDNKEVDFILEKPDGTIAGIEVKTADRVDAGAFTGLRVLQEFSGDDFSCGIVLYNGKETVPFGNKQFAVPFSALYS